MIEILSPAELARARETGALVAHILQTLKEPRARSAPTSWTSTGGPRR